ncbi:hypothetical protein QAD02_020942 [Eretmocerus hayati]|uniref:Uncharacterized protein n=1 Tax=Eretmocerus hayati TaxID=131215 RepID=A0ACC2PNI6_9HYME|nr:hypothetical protein QAD02_020942 [Eretmocerus hayati]
MKSLHVFNLQILNIEIEDLQIHVEYLCKQKRDIENQNRQSLSSTLADSFLGRQNAHSQVNKFKLDASHNRKFQSLHAQQESELTNNSDNNQIRSNTEKWFVNTTDMEIPTEIIETLALGPKFSQPSSLDKTSTIETVKNIEKLLDTYELDEQLAWTLRSHIVGNIYTQTKKPIPHITQESRIFTRKIEGAREFARDNKIMFTMADKGPHLRHQRSPASEAYRATPPLALAAAQRPSASATLLAGAQKLTAPDPAQQQLLDLLVHQTIQHSVPMQPLDTVRPAETRPPFLV